MRPDPPPPDLLGLPLDALGPALSRAGVGAHLAPAVFSALHRRLRPLADDPAIGPRNAAALEGETRGARVRQVAAYPAGDAEKLVFELAGGARVEGVLLPMRADRMSMCVSTQAGCAMGCAFCATARMGLSRSLDAGEIMGQIHLGRLHARAAGRRVTHVVFMGMGEPLHAYTPTRDAVRILLDPHGPCLAARRVTVSTVGLVPQMRRFAADFGGRVQLALSLHAGTDATRRRLIPLARRYDLAALKAACRDHPLPGSRHLMIEYVVLPGVNDTPAELDGLVEFARDLVCVVNLIPFNPFSGAPFRAPSPAELEGAGAWLRRHRVPHTIRSPRGAGVAGACGQLALRAPGDGR